MHKREKKTEKRIVRMRMYVCRKEKKTKGKRREERMKGEKEVLDLKFTS